MRVWASFYSKDTRKYYKVMCNNCVSIDEGIKIIKVYISKKHNIDKHNMINTNYGVIRRN